MASEFAQEFSKVLKGMEKERISREKKSEDALILRETKREADLTKAEVKQQQQAETDANRQKEINQTLKKFLNKDGNYRKNLSQDNKKIIENLENEQTQMKLDRAVAEQNIAKLRVEEKAATDYRSADVKAIEESKLALEEMKKRIEGQGGKADENKEFNKASLEIQQREFDLRLKNAGSRSAREEVEKERRAAIDKQGTLLQKIASGIGGIGANMKEKALAAGKGLMSIIKGTLFAGLLLAFAAFLKSPAFGATIDFIFDLIEKLGTFYDAFFGPEGSFGKGIKTLFGDESGFGLIVAGVIGLTALWAGKKLVKFLAPLSKGIVKLLTGIGAIGNQLPVVPKKRGPGRPRKTPLVPDLGKDKAPKTPSKLAKFAKGGLKASKFIPGFGLLITAASGLYDGVTAGLEEANKEGSTKVDVMREATSGVLSGLTFGLVEQKTFSDAFKKTGEAFSTAGDKISQDFNLMKDSVVSGFNKYLGPEAQWSKDFQTTLQNFKLPTLDEIGTSVKNFASDASKKFTELTGLEVPSFDEIGTKLSGFADDVKGKFTELTGITVPSFDEIQGKLTNLGTNLANKFEGLTGINLGDKFESVKSMLPNIGNPLRSLADMFVKSDYKILGYDIGKKLGGIINGMLPKDDGSVLMGGEEMASGGRVTPGQLYTINERGVETFIPDQPGQILSAERTNMMLKSGGGGKTTSAPIVIASTNTNAPVNHNSTNVASNTFGEPDPIFRRNTQFAI